MMKISSTTSTKENHMNVYRDINSIAISNGRSSFEVYAPDDNPDTFHFEIEDGESSSVFRMTGEDAQKIVEFINGKIQK